MPNSSYNISSFVCTLKFNNGSQPITETFYQLSPAAFSNNILVPNVFENETIQLDLFNAIQSISGIITFDNDDVKEFVHNSINTNSCTEHLILNDKIINPISNGNNNNFVPKGFGYRQIGIADYKKVVQEICCYDAGEVAHIENIMATEFKERTTEKNTTRETTLFESQETEKESISDTTTAQRFEMQTEVAKILQEQKQNEGHANVTASYGTATLDAGASFANSSSKEQSNRQAVTQAKDITQRAMERIVNRTKTEKTVKITESFKEINSHIYDNRGADSKNVSGVYRFINAIYKNQVF